MINNLEPKRVTDLVTTIIPVYNRAKMVERAIKSVVSQTYRPIEIIVVDDGSTDNTPEKLQQLKSQVSELKIIQQTNLGPGAARQAGLNTARGDYIQYLDSDDVLLPNKFADQIQALKNSSECQVVYGKTAVLADSELDIAIDRQEFGVPIKKTGEQIDRMFPAFVRERWWSTSTPLFKREVVDKAGSWLPLSAEEDWAYDCRVASLGTRLARVDEFVSITCRHDQHLSSGGHVDSKKLEDRCIARAHMYESIEKATPPIELSHRKHFAKAAFLLARECAFNNMSAQTKAMLDLSNKANGGRRTKTLIFAWLGKVFGWNVAARIVRLLES